MKTDIHSSDAIAIAACCSRSIVVFPFKVEAPLVFVRVR